MKKIFFPFFIVLLLFQSCGSAKKKAFDFNQKLAGISKTLNSKGVAFGTELRSAINTNDFSALDSMATALNKYISDQIIVVKNTENVSGSEKLKNAMLDFLNFEYKLVTEAFVPFGKLNTNSTEDEKQAAINTMVEKTKDESSYLLKIQAEQKDYATKNGFKLEETQ